ncbi:hypothetical protein D0T84_02335 [Dysgonomonas sp. 521]|nr:hypothetical protein [Dysgonomonas sp. 521]
MTRGYEDLAFQAISQILIGINNANYNIISQSAVLATVRVLSPRSGLIWITTGKTRGKSRKKQTVTVGGE